DASKIFQMDYQGLMEKEKGEFSKLCPALFKFQERGIIGLVHGDDFLVLAEDDQLTWMDGVLNSKYTARWEATVGDGELDGKEMFFLNRLIRYVADGTDGKRLEVEADARHAEILMRSFGFDSKTKGSDIPEDKIRDQDIIVEERSETLDEAQTGEFRSMTMRLAYLSQDRPDVIHASRTLASAMKNPKMGDWLRLKKVVRYLLKYPYMKRTFLEQRPEEVDVLAWSDSDWAGDLRTRRSTTGSVVKIGHHTVLIRAAGQKVVALSSAEGEFYGMCRTTTRTEFIRGVINFWGYAVTRVMLKVDSTDKVFAKEVAVVKVDGKENEADLVTKVQPATMIKGHLGRELQAGDIHAGRSVHGPFCSEMGYIDQLKELILKNQKAARRQLWAARFGRLMESLCRDADAERRLPQVQTPTSTTLEGADHSFVGRYYMKSSCREGTGKIFIHGDTLIFQTPTGEKSVSRIGVPLTGCTATTASFMVSARGPEGLALVRLWLKDAEEAEQMAAAIGTTGKASSDLIQRKTLSGASTMRRQMGRAAYGLCAAVAQVPQSLRRKLVPECNCFARKKKTRSVATSNNFRLDGRCCILPAKTTEVRACHATLRGDALWTGQKAGASDQVLSVINASAVATADMVAIRTRNGDLHRLFPDDHAGSASQWCQAIQAAGKMSKDLGKWEANLRSAFYKDTAKEKVQKLARWRRFRNLGQRLVSGASKLTGWLSWEHQLTGMEVLMAWQALSVIQADAVAPTTKAFPSRTAKFFRRADANKAMERTLEIRGDVMFVINQ
ncbi:unnamed protein product, partial [Effrenium voratum]